MNDRDLFRLMLDQPEPDFPSVVDAAVAGGKRIRRRRRVAVLGTGVGVLAIAGAGLFLAPSQQATVRPATDVPPAATTGTILPTPAVDAPASAEPASAAPQSALDGPTARAETRQEQIPPETQPRSGGRTTPPTTTLEDERKAKCLAVKAPKCQ
ncbi:hypothetical protein [Embleya hyalina]|uniref:Uncharacterized protein n=1 Tax=Embleya hyalina TaxID=516124 RepID=A0A401YSN4_9ACTN|nr:hypothetical protein [Embleya hyalina]GCD97572.1 hypothetical protein EHYA_05267 [Embleya hyalina]